MTREEAIQALKDLAEINVRYRCDDKWITALDMAISALSADRPSGEWLDVNGDGSLWECTNCHDKACCKGNFCSECGARMENTKNALESQAEQELDTKDMLLCMMSVIEEKLKPKE